MPHALRDGLALVDPIGRTILASTIVCLVAAVVANLVVRRRYLEIERELEHGDAGFAHPLLNAIVRQALAQRPGASNVQAIIEERFQVGLKAELLAERFIKAATGLVIILGLLGTFYGLTISIGRIVGLVSADAGAGADVAATVTGGLTHALSGMAVAFSNSLLGIFSAIVLTVMGVVSNVTDRRVGVMLQIETHLDRMLGTTPDGINEARAGGFGDAVARLERVVARFEAGLTSFSASSTDFLEFNAHLKDNIQRMSLSFGDLSSALKQQLGPLKPRDGR